VRIVTRFTVPHAAKVLLELLGGGGVVHATDVHGARVRLLAVRRSLGGAAAAAAVHLLLHLRLHLLELVRLILHLLETRLHGEEFLSSRRSSIGEKRRAAKRGEGRKGRGSRFVSRLFAFFFCVLFGLYSVALGARGDARPRARRAFFLSSWADAFRFSLVKSFRAASRGASARGASPNARSVCVGLFSCVASP
jgi:hypothetical protein